MLPCNTISASVVAPWSPSINVPIAETKGKTMGELTSTRELPVRAEHAWAVISDPNNFEKWLTLHVKWKSDVPASISEGSQMTEVVSMMGMPNTITWNVDEYDAPNAMAISGTGMAGVKLSIRLEVTPTDGGSRFDLSAAFEGQMIVGALGKAIEKQGGAELEESVAKLGELLS